MINLSSATRWGLNLVALLAAIAALRLGQTIFIPLIIALLLAALLWPAVRFLNRRLHFSWDFACLLMVTVVVAFNLLITLGIALAVPRMVQDLPSTPEKQQQVYTAFRSQLASISPVPLDDTYFPADAADSQFFKTLQSTLQPGGHYLTDALLEIAYLGGSWLWYGVLIVFILLFLLLEGPMLTRRIHAIFGPGPEIEAKVLEALTDMSRQVHTYLVWRTIINFGLALLVGLVYQWMGLRQPWTWAMLTAVLCYIPYLGPIAAGIPPVLDAFLSCPSPWYAVAIIVFYIVVINLEGYLVVPVVMGRHMQLNAITVILACLFWELVWGTPGLFLAMPLMAAVRAVCMHVPDWRPWANLMSTSDAEVTPALEPEEDVEKTQLLGPSATATIGPALPSVVDKK